MTDSLPKQMHDQTLARIVDRLKLTEVKGADGGPWLTLNSALPMAKGPVGNVRVFKGKPIAQVVTCTIAVPAIKLDSHMLFAFSESESAVPHFTLDSVKNGDSHAFHLDFIPRVDLAVALPYMDEVFTPLTDAFKKNRELPGMSPAQLDPRQYAVMSPWMLATRADEAAFKATFATVNTYLDHWFTVLERGVSPSAVNGTTPAQLASRDVEHRGILFNPKVDKVWDQISPLLGAENVQKIIGVLRNTKG